MKWPAFSRRWLFFPPIAVGVLTVAFLAFSKKQLERLPASEQARPLKVVRATTRSVAPTATGYGTARPGRIWSAVAEVGGRITQRHDQLRSGIHVQAGERLIRIDDADYKLRQAQRQADLEKARTQVEQSKLSRQSDQQSLAIQEKLLAVRKSELDRLEKLRGTAAASQSEEDAARASWLQQQQAVQTLMNTLSLYPPQLASAQASVDLAQSRLAEADRDVARTEINAPFDGVLSEVTLEMDQYVAPSERLFQLHDVQTIEVESQFSLSQLSQLLPGVATSEELNRFMSAEYYSGLSAEVITHSGDESIHYPGEPIRVREAIDERTRTLGIVIRVVNRDDDAKMPLRPGTYCEVFLTSKLTSEAITLPLTAIYNDQVLVVDKESRLRTQRVELGFKVGRQVTIVSGIGEGDLVVVKPAAALVPGALVDPEITATSDRDLASSRGESESR